MSLLQPPETTSQPRKKRSLFRNICLAALGLFLFIGFVSCMSENRQTSKPTTTQTPSASQPAPVVAEPQQPKEDVFNFSLSDDEGTVYKGKISSNVGVVVMDSEKQSSVGSNQFTRKSASGGATFVLIRVVVVNDRNDSVTMDSSLFKLLWDGKEYSISSEATTALMFDGVEIFFLKDINPGIQVQGVLAFETPDRIELDKASLQFSGGFFGKRTVVPATPVTQ